MANKTEQDQGGQAIDAQGQAVPASELAERHYRTSKHRVPKEGVRPRQKKAKPQPARRSEQGELPFRKTRAVVSWVSTESLSTRIIRVISIFLLASGLFALAFFTYIYFAGSEFFALRELDLQGNKLITLEKVRSIVEPLTKRGVLRADLAQISDRIKSEVLVEKVEVTRVLPDILRITILEREPYAPARRIDGTEVCVDRQGTMVGDRSLIKSKPVLPLINGLAEQGDRVSEVNRQRMMTYQQLIGDLDGSQPQMSSKVNEVYFDDVQGVRVLLAGSGIAVYLGNEDFRMRLNVALDVLDAIKRGDINALNVLRIGDAEKLLSGVEISYINATIPKRVVVGLKE